jgi:hypothetical protein
VSFDLSPGEERLAPSLASGLSLRDAAVAQDISFGTQRSYLEDLFRKSARISKASLLLY